MKGLVFMLFMAMAVAKQSIVHSSQHRLQIRAPSMRLIPRTNKRPRTGSESPPAKRLKPITSEPPSRPLSKSHSGSNSPKAGSQAPIPAFPPSSMAAAPRPPVGRGPDVATVHGIFTGPAMVRTHMDGVRKLNSIPAGVTQPVTATGRVSAGLGAITYRHPAQTNPDVLPPPHMRSRAAITGTGTVATASVRTEHLGSGTTFGSGDGAQVKTIGSNDKLNNIRATPPAEGEKSTITAGIAGPGRIAAVAYTGKYVPNANRAMQEIPNQVEDRGRTGAAGRADQ